MTKPIAILAQMLCPHLALPAERETCNLCQLRLNVAIETLHETGQPLTAQVLRNGDDSLSELQKDALRYGLKPVEVWIPEDSQDDPTGDVWVNNDPIEDVRAFVINYPTGDES